MFLKRKHYEILLYPFDSFVRQKLMVLSMTGIDDSFKEQITIFYLSHMRRVAQDLFDQGYKTSIVASKLLITKEKAERLRELYDKGLLLNTDTEQSTHNLCLPFGLR